MQRKAPLLLLSLLFLASTPSQAEEGGAGVAVSTKPSNIFIQTFDVIGGGAQKLGRSAKDLGLGIVEEVGSGARTLGKGAQEVGRQVQQQAKSLTKGFRHLAIEVGSGLDTGKEVIDPFVPKGLDRLLDWDMRLLIRNDGLGLRGLYLHPAFFEKISLDYKLKYDTFKKLGLKKERDDLYHSVGAKPSADKRGFSLGASAVLNEHWGTSLGYDKTLMSEDEGSTRDKVTTFGVGYTPLGRNDEKPWNWTIVASVNYEDVVAESTTTRKHGHGYGYAAGPVFQYGLDKIPIPLTRTLGIEKKVKLDRFRAGLMLSDSEIHPLSIRPGFDVTAYATEYLKFSAGAHYAYMPGIRKSVFSVDFGFSLLINFMDLRF